MPKRVVDGEGIWTSRKLKLVDPEWIRGEYANLLPLALANGVFEFDIDQIWARVYAYLRPDISRDDVVSIFTAYERAGLFFSWEDEDGKRWGFWIGIDKPGRLPSLKRQKGRHERVGPEPPREKLEQYLRGASQRSANGRPSASLGFGLGSGSGSGSGNGSRAAHAPAPAPSAPAACKPSTVNGEVEQAFVQFYSAYPRKVGQPSARKSFRRIPSVTEHLGEILLGIARWQASGQWTEPRFIPHPARFLNDRRWEDQPLRKEAANGKKSDSLMQLGAAAFQSGAKPN